MIITFLDGSKKEFEKGVSSLDIANSISSSLAKKSVFALVNGEAYDLTRPILEDSTLEQVYTIILAIIFIPIIIITFTGTTSFVVWKTSLRIDSNLLKLEKQCI